MDAPPSKTLIRVLMPAMDGGGVERALVDLLHEIPEEPFAVELVLFETRGPFLSVLPAHVTVSNIRDYIPQYVDYFGRAYDYFLLARHGRLRRLVKVLSLLPARRRMRRHKIAKERYYARFLGSIETPLPPSDILLCFFGLGDELSTALAAKAWPADRKAKWSHTDLVANGFDASLSEKYLASFDHLFGVSEPITNQLRSLFPDFSGSIMTMPNVISPQFILEKSTEGVAFDDEFDGIRILTVGRLAPQKGYDIAIRVLARLKEEKLRVRWYAMGVGNQEKELIHLAKSLGVSSDFVLLGFRENPYPWMLACDLYVQPSRWEGYCITTTEAALLGKPIVTTDTAGAREKFGNSDRAVIVPVDEEAIFEAVHKFCTALGNSLTPRQAAYPDLPVGKNAELLLSVLA